MSVRSSMRFLPSLLRAFLANGPEGRRITLQYGEVLQDGKFYRENLRTAQAEYTWISNGKRQFARPHFTFYFYGFRYVKVTGMEVNRLISNTKWSQKGNFLDIPTDCPQRDERLGWTGDAQIFSRAASYHMQTPTFFRKYMKDMGFEQREKGGAVPYVGRCRINYSLEPVSSLWKSKLAGRTV